MFFNASAEFAFEHGGPITRAFLARLPDEWVKDVVFDSRIHMLMPGWSPAIPGWHHDDVPRPDVIPVGQHFGTAGQPDYDSPRYLSQHVIGLVNAEICPTAFAVGKCTLPQVPEGQTIYRVWNDEIDRQVAAGILKRETLTSGVLAQFSWDSFHTATFAVGNGWRWFGRVTRHSERCSRITNEIRQQVQVYLRDPMQGW